MAATVSEPAWWIEALGWLELRKKQIGYAAVAVLVVALGISYALYARSQREVAAARALSEAVAPMLLGETQSLASGPLLEVAQRYAGTRAGGHALLLAATALSTEGDLVRAQARFEEFLREYRQSPLLNQAVFGLASCLHAQGRTNEAMDRYQSLAERRLETDPVVFLARLRLGQLCEQRGEWERARRYYEEVARALPMAGLGGEARLYLQALLEAHPELVPSQPGGESSTNGLTPPTQP
ncbi:MAG: tetratricopeptide repeat protein [Limisphaera sp.]|nr:tetratricopeptide repeat protein [Limisphaera sp.]